MADNLFIVQGTNDRHQPNGKYYAIELGRDNSYSDYSLNDNTEITNPAAVEILNNSDLQRRSNVSSEWFEKFGKAGQEPATPEAKQQMESGLNLVSKEESKRMHKEATQKREADLAAKNEAIDTALGKASGQIPTTRDEKKAGHKELKGTDDHNKMFQKHEGEMYVGYVKSGPEAQAGYTAYFEKAKSRVYESGLDITREFYHGGATKTETAKSLSTGEAAKLALKQTMNDVMGR